jgi:flagellar basal-body rod protein FlgF
MDSGLYSSYSGVKALAEMLEVLSNNLANVNTTGFKSDETFFRIYNHALAESTMQPLDKAINDSSVVQGTTVNFQPGPSTTTGRDLDVALEGQGFFVVETPNGVRYTRNGNFNLNAQGRLVTSEGFTVLGKQGPIILKPGKVDIAQNGDIQVNGMRADSLRIVDFSDKRQLEKVGNSLFNPRSGAASEIEANTAVVRQGNLEQSNVNPVRQMTLMISMIRQFESLQKSIQMMMNTMNDRSINQVGRAVL